MNEHLFSVTYADCDSSIPDSPIPLQPAARFARNSRKTRCSISSWKLAAQSCHTQELEECAGRRRAALASNPSGEFPSRKCTAYQLAIRSSESAVQNRFFNSSTGAASQPPTAFRPFFTGTLGRELIPLTWVARQSGVVPFPMTAMHSRGRVSRGVYTLRHKYIYYSIL